MNVEINAREQYRQHLQRRQTVVFGSIIATMMGLFLIATVFWTGLIPFPFDPGFSTSPKPVSVPCPTSNKPVEPKTITAQVYNSTTRAGLAGKVAQALKGAGVSVTDAANWSGSTLKPSATIFAGTDGIDVAYTLRAYFPGSTVSFDSTQANDTVYIVMGSTQEDMVKNPTAEQFAAAMQPIEGCQTVQSKSTEK
ncbi:LytR C-terminal domain-containing protein [Arcanobacterium canis]